MTGRKGKTLCCILGLLHFSISWINDDEFGEYLEEIDGEYSEIGTTPKDLSKAVTGHITYRKNWHFTGFGEVPYLVMIYKRSYTKFGESYVKLKPGNYCGGLRLTVMRFITSCRCLNTWYHWKIGAIEAPSYRPWEIDPYDIQARRIFVTVMRMRVVFEPDDQFELDTSDLGQCGLGRSPKVEAIIVKFIPVDATQDTPHFELDELLPWPPKPLPQLESQPGSRPLGVPESALKGFLTSYGMTSLNGDRIINDPILNDFGEEIPVNLTSVSVGVQEVPLRGECVSRLNAAWNLMSDSLRAEETANFSLVCFHVTQEIPKGDKQISICGGAPGFPVLRDGAVHGLVVEPLDCDLGFVVTLAFDSTLKENIEDVVDPSLLNVVKFVKPGIDRKNFEPLDKLYEYNYFWDLYGAKPLSRSSCQSPNCWSLCIILIRFILSINILF